MAVCSVRGRRGERQIGHPAAGFMLWSGAPSRGESRPAGESLVWRAGSRERGCVSSQVNYGQFAISFQCLGIKCFLLIGSSMGCYLKFCYLSLLHGFEFQNLCET